MKPTRCLVLATLIMASVSLLGQAARTKKAAATIAPAVFTDVTRASGIDFHLTCGSLDKRYIMDSMCGGVAVFDYDNDGWMDIYFTNGSTLEDMRASKCHSGKLYRNQHDGTFIDVTAKSGLNRCGWGFGVAVGDYDNDGWEDLYLTYLNGGVLLHNNRDGTFTDVTAQAGVDDGGRWGTSAAFGDYDRDGKLDLYVANYVDLDLNHLPPFGVGPFCQYRGIAVSCGPRGLKGSRDRLYHNNGDGTFTDVSDKLKVDPDGFYALAVIWLDYDKDGCPDIYVANDSSPSLLYHNDCKGGFTEVGAEAGVAYSADGREQAGMGIDSEDYDNDGWPDIIKANFSDDTNNLYRNDQHGGFSDLAGPAGFGPISMPFLAFGMKFLDFDNDGWKDVFVANGHVNPQVDQHSFGVTYAEHPFLFHNTQNGKFSEISSSAGSALTRRYVGRGAATGDFRNNGRQDVVMTVLDGSPVLLRNGASKSGHWLRIKTVGSISNRDGFGARVEVKAGGLTQESEIRANSSFESASDPRLHFGLGDATTADSILVRWPSGKTSRLGPTKADQELVIQESGAAPESVPQPPPSGTSH
ncbi:MAG TPA: CRTAC1 family protein [Terriglobales bacterium]|nr:CRTAC1 family protein [Terriglobales bacterium]